MAIEVKHATQATGTDAGNGEIAKTQWNESHTINMATGKLLGRSTAGAGAAEEIALGSGLSLSAGTLSASGGGGGSALTISNKTAAYTVVAGDLGTIINCSGATSFTVSLTAAATLGAGFNCWIWNTSTTTAMAVTIDPSGAETIDGVATLVLRQGEGTQIVCDGTNWQTVAQKEIRGFAENFSPTQTRPVASGGNSIALGILSSATGSPSIAIGGSASGSYSVAIGHYNSTQVTAGGGNSVAVGNNSGGNGAVTATNTGMVALGGSYASGTDSFAAAVANNTSSYGAKGANSIAIGSFANATGTNSVVIGRESTASNVSATAFGYGSLASGAGSFAHGYIATLAGATASGAGSIAFGPGSTSAERGKFSFSSDNYWSNSTSGTAQYGLMVLRRFTSDATSGVLVSSQNNTAATNNQVILPNNSAYSFTGTVVAKQSGSTNAAAWKVEGLIVRGANAASTTLVASTATAISNVPGWTLALSADTTNGGLAVTATGAAATNIRWVATIQTSEVTYA